MHNWIYVVAAIYILAATGLFVHGVNSYVLVFGFLRHRRRQVESDRAERAAYWRDANHDDLPTVTVQVPIYNERYVIGRQIDALAALDYPRDRYEIQILDDSTDDTVDLVANLTERYRSQGLDIQHIRRANRDGFKAGALKHGTALARGELLAIFDADFVPQPDFLRNTVPYFTDDGIGLVQTRWGHINGNESFLTFAQSVGIDGHFSVEQAGRAWSHYFMNFNGTAGVWRNSAIEDAGGWQSDTLTEDLDLSYRAQLRGWRVKYLLDTVTPAEIPSDINAFKSQQYRWAKGSIQTAMKNIPRLLRCDASWWVKYQAILHMTHYTVHPLMVTVAVLSIPMLLYAPVAFGPLAWGAIALLLGIATFGPSTLYTVSQRSLYAHWWKRILVLPGLVCLGTGIAVNNSRAVFEAIFGIRSGFVRTPKSGTRTRAESLEGHRKRRIAGAAGYVMPITWTLAIELLLGLYCMAGVGIYVRSAKYLIGPFLLVYGAGFLLVATMSLRHILRAAGRVRMSRDFED